MGKASFRLWIGGELMKKVVISAVVIAVAAVSTFIVRKVRRR